ncbi:hypothetical protein DPQ22_05380 [Candidatus Tokpelaia sp.]|nr:hypothetical protein DPQ22_05380 [Candidatus Tokpelaia sp.]
MVPLVSVGAASRRRLVLSTGWRGGALQLGFNRLHSHEIIAVEQCPVAEPVLVAALPFLRHLLALLRARREGCHIVLTAAENGLDIALQGLTPPLKEEEKLRSADYVIKTARAANIVRLSSDAEIIVDLTRPFVLFGTVPVDLPPGGFLQAVRGAEEHMGALAAHALRRCKNVADLFAGCGSFTFRLAENSNIHAVEQNKAALAALAQAAARAASVQAAAHGAASSSAAAAQESAALPAAAAAQKGREIAAGNVEAKGCEAKERKAADRIAAGRLAAGSVAENSAAGDNVPAVWAAASSKPLPALKRISCEQRDLFRQPLTARELAAYDGLVFDPPRAGAEAQAREIAKSAVKTVVAVSCNSVTLARDMVILLAGGYHLQSITPIDQFLWSPHSEAVAILTKRPAKKTWQL